VKDGEDAGIIAKSLLNQNIQGPDGILPYGKGGCPIPPDGGMSDLLQGPPAPAQVSPKFLRGLPVDVHMPVSMTGYLMAFPLNLPHQLRVSLSVPSENEKSRPGLKFLKEIEKAMHIRSKATLLLLPFVEMDHRFHNFCLEVVFHIN
jgi:hypothetical protein